MSFSSVGIGGGNAVGDGTRVGVGVASGLTTGFIVAVGAGVGVDVASGLAEGFIVAVGTGVDVASGLADGFTVVALGVGLGVAVPSACGKQAARIGATTTVPPKANTARRNSRLLI
jgi:hypothetical protein